MPRAAGAAYRKVPYDRRPSAAAETLPGRWGIMPMYLQIASYTPDGLRGLLKEGGTGALEEIAKMGEVFDTKPNEVMFAFGEDDVYVSWELPDNESAAAISLAMAASGATRVRTVVLIEPEELDRAIQRNVSYGQPRT
jgi:uncharacterized protein with GYD domain